MAQAYWDGDVYVGTSGRRYSPEEMRAYWELMFRQKSAHDPHYKPIEPDSRNVDPFLKRRMWK